MLNVALFLIIFSFKNDEIVETVQLQSLSSSDKYIYNNTYNNLTNLMIDNWTIDYEPRPSKNISNQAEILKM